AAALIDALILARQKRQQLHDLSNVRRHPDFYRRLALGPRLLFGNRDSLIDGRRIMRADLAADAVLQWRDDLAARRIILGIRREHQREIERQTDGIALNLHVALLHDVEQSHLDLAREVGKLVDGEEAAIRARQQAIVDGELVGDVLA